MRNNETRYFRISTGYVVKTGCHLGRPRRRSRTYHGSQDRISRLEREQLGDIQLKAEDGGLGVISTCLPFGTLETTKVSTLQASAPTHQPIYNERQSQHLSCHLPYVPSLSAFSSALRASLRAFNVCIRSRAAFWGASYSGRALRRSLESCAP